MFHPIYGHINDEKTLKIFMENHVYSVWDFQSLLKSLQVNLSCIEIPWIPTSNRESRRFINEIVLDEESSGHPNGGYASHFELYREAMGEVGAECTKIDILISELRNGKNINYVINKYVSNNAKKFVKSTFKYIFSKNLCELMAIFTYRREDIIPDMFEKLIKSFNKENQKRWSKFTFYLKEHIICDRDKHGPMAKNILYNLCKENELKWNKAENAAVNILNQRILMWDKILVSISTAKN
tara:strand:- start:301 stop:1020 length:720 start_codon:yes stop_codon:yes gene_type:complete